MSLYFAAGGQAIPQLAALTTRYGDGAAVAAADYDSVLTAAYRPAGLTVLLVFRDATAEVRRTSAADFELRRRLRELTPAPPSASPATAS